MKIYSISTDNHFHDLCSDALEDSPDTELFRAVAPAGIEPADIYVCDFDRAKGILTERRAESEVVYVARRDELATLHLQASGRPIAVLVRPFNVADLRRFLQAAISRRNARRLERADPRRQERDQLFECVLQAGLKLQQFGTEQSNFMSRALHDLWAPLTAADGYCSVLLQDAVASLSLEQAETLRRLQASLRRLSRTTSLVHQLGASGSDQESPMIAPADIAECVEHAVSYAQPLARERKVDLRTSVIRPPEPLYFDAGWIQLVLDNLLENACRFTPKAGAVELEALPVVWKVRRFRLQSADGRWFQPGCASAESNAYRVNVRDSGPPVEPSELLHLFDQYSPYHSNHGRSSAGLGLAACRSIINGHCGDLVVEPQAEGATFSFVLPLVIPEPGCDSISLQQVAGEGIR